jgi:hypothetical protein
VTAVPWTYITWPTRLPSGPQKLGAGVSAYVPTNWLPPTTTAFLAGDPPLTEAMSVARSGGLAFVCASELRPVFEGERLNVPLFPLASL